MGAGTLPAITSSRAGDFNTFNDNDDDDDIDDDNSNNNNNDENQFEKHTSSMPPCELPSSVLLLKDRGINTFRCKSCKMVLKHLKILKL